MSRQEIDRNVEIIQSPSVTVTPHAVHTTVSVQMESKIVPMTDHLLVVGAEVWERELDSRREKYFFSLNKIIGERPIPSSTYFSGGIYAQDEWNILPDKLMMTLGARYDWIRVRNDKTFNPEYVITSGILQTNTVDSTVLWNSGSVQNEYMECNCGVAVHHRFTY